MEGFNFGGFLIGCLGVLVLGISTLLATGLLLARKPRAAMLTFAAGLLASAALAAVVSLTFLQKGQGFGQEGHEPLFLMMALSLILAGAAPITASLRNPGAFPTTLGFALGAAALLLLAIPATGHQGAGPIIGIPRPLMLLAALVLIASLLLAGHGLRIAIGRRATKKPAKGRDREWE